MKKILLLTLAVASLSAYGQGLRIGSYYHRQQRQKAELRKNISEGDMSTKQDGKKGSLLRDVYLDQATKVSGDNIYRYVFTYNKNMERSSETIYKKHFNGASWSDEELYTKGTYSYEYDMFGRIVNKTVKYDRYTSEFDSYCVHVNYNDALDYTDTLVRFYSLMTVGTEIRNGASGTMANCVIIRNMRGKAEGSKRCIPWHSTRKETVTKSPTAHTARNWKAT